MSEIRERFTIHRQIQTTSKGQTRGALWNDITVYGSEAGVSGRVLDLVKNELLLHLPDLDPDQVDEIVHNIVGRLYRPEVFDFDKTMEADEYWQRGMYRAS
jgi:hypothetical protein